MGLDTVELVIEIEQEFNIRLPDADAEKLRTVGDLTAYVWGCFSVVADAPCATSRAFYMLRRAIMEITGAPRGAIRPGTHMQSVFPLAERPRAWNLLRTYVPGLPDLEASRVVVDRMVAFIAAGLGIGALLGGMVGFHIAGAIVMGMLGAIGAVVAATPLYIASRRHVPASCATLGEASIVMARSLSDDTPGFSRTDIEHRVRVIVANTLGARLEDVHLHSRFVEDLGAD